MRVLYVPVGDESNPGARYRVYAHLPYLRLCGHEVTVLSPMVSKFRRRASRVWRTLDIVRAAARAAWADVVVLYRTTFPPPANRLLRRRARALVFELDDAIWLPAPAEPQDARTATRYRANFLATLAVSDLIVAGNQTLAAEVGSTPCEVLPTGVDVGRFDPHHGGREPGDLRRRLGRHGREPA